MTVTYENSDVSESNDSPDNASINNDLKVDKISSDEKKEVTEDKSKFKKFTDLFNVFSWKYHDLESLTSPLDKLKYLFLCPPHGYLASIITWSLVVVTIWAASYVILGQIALPGREHLDIGIEGGTIFSLIMLLVLAHLGGMLVALVKLPPLLGMLIVGILVNFIPRVNVIGDGLDPKWSSALRSTALTVILLRAGLGLDPIALRKLSAMVFRLAFSPCLAETVIVAVASHLLLGFPWQWGFMLGFILAAVSPAVVVPCLLSLQEQGYGVAKGIPTLVIAAASMDDVLAISAFTILLGITFTTEDSSNVVSLVFKGPKEAVIGILWGIGWGLLLIFFPPAVPNPAESKRPTPSAGLRTLLIVGGGLLAVFGSNKADVPGAGALAVLTMGFVAGLGWRGQGYKDDNPVCKNLANLWVVFQPLLFGLIGTEIKVSELDGNTVGYGIGVLICGLSVRVVVSYLAVLGGNLTHRERLFISMAWLPKATVQAAVGPLALDLANHALREATDAGAEESEMELLREQQILGKQVLAIAVLVILITAPIGAIAVMTAGPKLLEKLEPDNEKSDDIKLKEKHLEEGFTDLDKEK